MKCCPLNTLYLQFHQHHILSVSFLQIGEDSAKCRKCGGKMSAYFCPICKHFTSIDKNPYHCEKCGICRQVTWDYLLLFWQNCDCNNKHCSCETHRHFIRKGHNIGLVLVLNIAKLFSLVFVVFRQWTGCKGEIRVAENCFFGSDVDQAQTQTDRTSKSILHHSHCLIAWKRLARNNFISKVLLS